MLIFAVDSSRELYSILHKKGSCRCQKTPKPLLNKWNRWIHLARQRCKKCQLENVHERKSEKRGLWYTSQIRQYIFNVLFLFLPFCILSERNSVSSKIKCIPRMLLRPQIVPVHHILNTCNTVQVRANKFRNEQWWKLDLYSGIMFKMMPEVWRALKKCINSLQNMKSNVRFFFNSKDSSDTDTINLSTLRDKQNRGVLCDFNIIRPHGASCKRTVRISSILWFGRSTWGQEGLWEFLRKKPDFFSSIDTQNYATTCEFCNHNHVFIINRWQKRIPVQVIKGHNHLELM